MKKLGKKFWYTSAAVPVIFAPVVAVASCGNWGGNFELRLNNETDSELDNKIAMVTDGGSVDDRSFNEQGYQAYNAISKRGKESVLRPDGMTSFEIRKRYETAAKAGSRVIITPGFHHLSAIQSFIKSFGQKKVGFILIDALPNLKDGQKWTNVASITYETKYSGFLAGYLSAKYLIELVKDKTPTLGTFGGGNFPGVTNFMVGFVEGAKFYNDSKKPTHKVKFAKFARKEDYTNSGFTSGQGRTIAQKLLEQGSDIILPVSGPQTGDVISAIKGNPSYNNVKIIGVDTDQALQYPADSSMFLTSIEKKISLSIQKVWKIALGEKTENDPGFSGIKSFGENTLGTLENDLTTISRPHVNSAERIYEDIINDKNLSKKAVEITDGINWNQAIEDLTKM